MNPGRYQFRPQPEPDEEAALRQALRLVDPEAVTSEQQTGNGWVREARREAVGRAGDDDE